MCSAYRSETTSDPVENRSHSHRRKRGAGLVSESVLTATTNMSEYGTFLSSIIFDLERQNTLDLFLYCVNVLTVCLLRTFRAPSEGRSCNPKRRYPDKNRSVFRACRNRKPLDNLLQKRIRTCRKSSRQWTSNEPTCSQFVQENCRFGTWNRVERVGVKNGSQIAEIQRGLLQ